MYSLNPVLVLTLEIHNENQAVVLKWNKYKEFYVIHPIVMKKNAVKLLQSFLD